MGRPIMIQGTMSNVGKSLITAALCRIFKQDGYSAAPFKSQNMALNSHITPDGLEIGRAQALQAEAAGIEPSALMNPILLKPTTDIGSQVIVNGKVYGNMRAREYFKHKKELIPEILKAYETLSSQHDIIVVEGAGSPVELNLKKDDIVNMGLAELIKSPVLLVGDIDRGGIFAQLLGTLSLLEPSEKAMVKGLIVNRFRGDKTLFSDGVDILEERGGVKVTGVVPHIDHCLEDEDSLSDRLTKKNITGEIDIAVIHLPKISNFTDFDVFSQFRSVSVRYVSQKDELGTPDLLVIPGTKSTIADMKWLRETGMEETVKRCAKNDVPIFGICGGYQILGRTISDPFASESGGSIDGIGLLPCVTVFDKDKKQSRTEGRFFKIEGCFSALSYAAFYGYEIHMGRTEEHGIGLTEAGGCFSGNVAGCYIHGIFDSAEVSGRLIEMLCRRKGIKYTEKAIDRKKYRDRMLDELADAVRQNMDMKAVYRIMEEGI